MCNFSGNVAPEIIKTRPVVVICTMKRPRLLMVVPLSTTQPSSIELWHYPLSHNPLPGDVRTSWAKCDLATTVRFDRLDRYRDSSRKFHSLNIGIKDLQEIRNRVAVSARVQLAPGTVTSFASQFAPPAPPPTSTPA